MPQKLYIEPTWNVYTCEDKSFKNLETKSLSTMNDGSCER